MGEQLRVPLYCRPNTSAESIENQRLALELIASANGWTVVGVFRDNIVTAPKARSDRSTLDYLLKAAARREFEVVVTWSITRLGRTTRHLIDVVNALHEQGVDLYSHEDGIDTKTASGKSAFVAFAALARHEHQQICERARISLDRARRAGVRLGRPSNVNSSVKAAIVALRERGFSIRRIASELRVGNRSVYAALEAARVHMSPEVPP